MGKQNQLKADTENIFNVLPQKNASLGITNNVRSITSIFSNRNSGYLNELQLFLLYHNRIPNCITEYQINCHKANPWFVNTYQDRIVDWYYAKRYRTRTKSSMIEDIYYVLDDDLIINFDTEDDSVRFLFKTTPTKIVDEIITGIKEFRYRDPKMLPTIGLLVNTTDGVTIEYAKITKPKLNIADNYNDDFLPIHDVILKRLRRDKDKGIVLLHGNPGTGKTSYIRYLITLLRKEVIFLPPDLAHSITGPGLMSVMISNPNSILVIEDAENIVMDRNADGNSPVSALLNVADGLLSDCLNIQIICSFNTDITKIDNALLRKGRLIAKYEFKALETEKARHLANKLAPSVIINKPTPLCDIYNHQEIDFKPVKQSRTIGFQTGRNSMEDTGLTANRQLRPL